MDYVTDPAASTAAQRDALFRGIPAVVAAPILAFASLANGQTFATITPALAADSRTINAALAASTDRPTFCAALAAELNAAGTTAYVWTVNGTSDGLVGTAKAPGSPFNQAPTGTALVGGVGSVVTYGSNAIASSTVIDFMVANDFDPTISGLNGFKLSRAFTYDGSKAWRKYASPLTAWERIDSPDPIVLTDTQQVVSTGAVLDNLTGWKITAILKTVGTQLTLRFNGATTGLVTAGYHVIETTPSYGMGSNGLLLVGRGFEQATVELTIPNLKETPNASKPMHLKISGREVGGTHMYQDGSVTCASTTGITTVDFYAVHASNWFTAGSSIRAERIGKYA